MSSRRFKLRNLAAKLRTPLLQRIGADLKAGGEFGRAVPGVEQAYARTIKPAVVATEPPPAIGQRSEISTHFTIPGRNTLLYRADSWVYLSLVLLDAGPVAVGTRTNVAPVLSGAGGLLVQNEVFRFPVTKGQRIFITANTVQRVRVSIEAPPYGEQILKLLASILGKG